MTAAALRFFSAGGGSGVVGGGGGDPDPGGSGEVVPFVYGMNLGTAYYFNSMPIWVDLCKQGIGWRTPAGGGAFVAVDSNGYPNSDFVFSLQRLPPDHPLSQTITIHVEGNPGTVSLENAVYWTLGATSYDSGTDTATVTLTSPGTFAEAFAGCSIKFTNTKKTSASGTNTGVRRVTVPRLGYTSVVGDAHVSDEYKSIMSCFGAFRFVKVTLAEVDIGVVSWDDWPRRNTARGRGYGGEDSGIMSIEDIVALANECHINPWINIQGYADYSLGVDSVPYGLAQYVEDNLDPDLVCVYENINETWNFAYRWFGRGNDLARMELRGFWDDDFARAAVPILTAQRASNVITIGLGYAHGMVAPETYEAHFNGRNGTGNVTATPVDSTHFSIPDTGTDCKIAFLGLHYGVAPYYDARVGGERISGVVTAFSKQAHGFTTGDTVYVPLAGLTSVSKLFTVTVTSATQFTFSDAGSDTGLYVDNYLTGGHRPWGASLGTGSPLGYDGDYSPSMTMSEKYWTRKAAQMSDLIESAVPSDTFKTRHRPVYMTQQAGGSIYRYAEAASMLAAVGTTFAEKFSAIGGGSYPDGTNLSSQRRVQDSNNPTTKAQFLADYTDCTVYGLSDGNGTPSFMPDLFASYAMSQGVPFYNYEVGIDTKIYSTGPYRDDNAYELKQATLDDDWKQIEKNYPLQLAQNGVSWGNMFNGEMTAQSDVSGMGYWAMSWGTLSASPKQISHHEWADDPPTFEKNVVPGAVDARLPIAFIDGYNGGAAFSYGGYSYPTMDDPWTPFPLPNGRWRYVINSVAAAGDMTLTIGYKTLAAVAHTITVIRNGVTLGTVSLPSVGVGNMGESTSITVPMTHGPNGIDLLRDSDNADFEIHTLNFA